MTRATHLCTHSVLEPSGPHGPCRYTYNYMSVTITLPHLYTHSPVKFTGRPASAAATASKAAA